MGMDENEFRRLLNLFPVVRPRDFHLESEASKQPSFGSAQKEELQIWEDAWGEGSGKDLEIEGTSHRDAFWEMLRLAVEKKVGAAEAERFCKAFKRIHNKLVQEELSPEAAQKFVNSMKISN